ncbi:MAG: hypothetical protein ACLGSD_01685 [Acidobacteriota bacterium]
MLSSSALFAQDARQFVQKAVNVELAKDKADHSHWLYFEFDKKPTHSVKQWVADTSNGSLKRVISLDGRKLSPAEQQARINKFLSNPSALAKQRKSNAHDDQQAAEMLELLPKAFIWTREADRGDDVILHFKPDPNFNPPDFESKVFAAMEGEMAVDKTQLRIATIKGKLMQDVKIFGGLLGELDAGGTFDVERRATGGGVWQITETHVHIQGHALIFKTISEQEDDVKSDFKELPPSITVQQAKNDLLQVDQETASGGKPVSAPATQVTHRSGSMAAAHR